MNILDAHINFIEKRCGKPLDSISSNIGYVYSGTSILSKIYETKEYVETFYNEGLYTHEVTSIC